MIRKTIVAALALCACAVMPAFVLAQDTTTQTQIITTLPAPESDYGMAIYNMVPVADQPGFINYITGFPPDQRIMVVRTLHMYSLGGDKVMAFTTDTTPDVAMPVFVNVLTPTDQPTFTTFWNGMTRDQQNLFINYARDVYPMATTTTETTTISTPPESSGMAAQPFGITMAAAFVSFLPEAEHDSYIKLASDTPTSELGGMNNFLNSLTPEQAGMCIHALASLNAMGLGGAKPQQGMSDYNVKKLLMGQIPEANQSAFQSMIDGMNDQQRSTLEQLARDAYNGGMNDVGATATTTTTTP